MLWLSAENRSSRLLCFVRKENNTEGGVVFAISSCSNIAFKTKRQDEPAFTNLLLDECLDTLINHLREAVLPECLEVLLEGACKSIDVIPEEGEICLILWSDLGLEPDAGLAVMLAESKVPVKMSAKTRTGNRMRQHCRHRGGRILHEYERRSLHQMTSPVWGLPDMRKMPLTGLDCEHLRLPENSLNKRPNHWLN